jgi:hypothetical protein
VPAFPYIAVTSCGAVSDLFNALGLVDKMLLFRAVRSAFDPSGHWVAATGADWLPFSLAARTQNAGFCVFHYALRGNARREFIAIVGGVAAAFATRDARTGCQCRSSCSPYGQSEPNIFLKGFRKRFGRPATSMARTSGFEVLFG